MARLLYIGQQVADDLSDGIASNIERYRGGDFLDMEAAGDWRIPLSIDADVSQLSELVPGNDPESEVRNSLAVGHALGNLTPTLARENRIWIRLSHVECLDYSRKRWLPADATDDRLKRDVHTHFFAATLTACRDDHAVARLWWNHRIAAQMMPENPSRALKVILARADIRQGLVERSGIGARPVLGRAIVRALEGSEELLRKEPIFREFMKKVNLLGAGVAFELWSNKDVDGFMNRCAEQAIAAASTGVADTAAT